MSDRLCEFARCANPNTENYVEWKAGGKKALILGDKETGLGNPSSLKLWVTMFTNEAPGE